MTKSRKNRRGRAALFVVWEGDNKFSETGGGFAVDAPVVLSADSISDG